MAILYALAGRLFSREPVAAVGPIALFDKSFLQGLNVDEAVLFDHFFLPVISPLFFVETLADLAKAPKGDRNAEEVVSSIAYKSPEVHGAPCAFHVDLGVSSLMGHEPPATGQIPMTGGRPVRTDGKTGVVYEQSPEAEAFSRWQEGKFHDVERLFAKAWRDQVENVDLRVLADASKRFGVDPKSAKSLEQVKPLAEEVIRRLSAAEQINLAVHVVGVEDGMRNAVFRRWFAAGNPPLEFFAPYAFRTVLIETFFSLALASGKISADRPSHRCDISYLHYLPFCLVFVSSDRLHRDCARLFLRRDQEFVWGLELKADLASQSASLKHMPQNELEELGLISLGPRPTPGLIRSLWERHVPRALSPATISPQKPHANEVISQMIERISNSPTDPKLINQLTKNAPDSITVKRMISKKKGSWFQLPKDFESDPGEAGQ